MRAMATYVRAGLPEVATALAALTGEPHPLAVEDPAGGHTWKTGALTDPDGRLLRVLRRERRTSLSANRGYWHAQGASPCA